MIRITHRGDFSKTTTFLKKLQQQKYRNALSKYAEEGLTALQSATPEDTGVTANSWSYKIEVSRSKLIIRWINDNVTTSGVPVVILLQYGHGTTGGTFVEGKDFINPVMKPIFDKISNNIWKEVISG